MTSAVALNGSHPTFNVAAPQGTAVTNKYAGFYGISIVNASVQPAIWGVVFKIGTGGANVLADLDLQGGYAYENHVWYIDDPVIYQPTDTVYVLLRNAVSQTGGVNVCLRGFLAEPAGQSVM